MKGLPLIFLQVTLLSCSPEESSTPVSPASGDWLINKSLVFDGGPGKDGIPALTDPAVAKIGDGPLGYLDEDDRILLYKNGDIIRGYPHKILDWHEIANDQIGTDPVAVVYCPLTGTGLGWGRELKGELTTFGVSGLLYETNIMPYDRLTDSYWNQMFNQCVNGELIGQVPEFFNLVQMTYASLKAMYPDAEVLTRATGFSRDYQRYPYGSYLTNTQTLFPVVNMDQRLHPKEFVRGVVIDDKATAFRFPDTGRQLQVTNVAGSDIVVVADKENGFIVSFVNKTIDGEPLVWALIEDQASSAILTDQLGNTWNVFGEAVAGPNEGETLEVPYSYMGFWFAWANFYPEIELADN